MQVNWSKLLTRLGCQVTEPDLTAQHCPLHPSLGKTLKISRDIRDPVQGRLIFSCSEPHCNFHGDAVLLVSRVKKIGLDEAINLFRPGRELEDILDPDTRDMQLEEYLYERYSQARILDYLGQSQTAIRNTLKGEALRSKMSQHGALTYGNSNLDDVPKTLGLLVPEALPPVLAAAKAHVKANCAVYPYTYDGFVTAVRIQNFDEEVLPSTLYPVTHRDVGIFMEDNLHDEITDLFVTPNEMAACQLNRRYSNSSSKRPPLISILGFPLPARLRKLKHVVILPCTNAPFTLAMALKLFAADEIVEGKPEGINLYVRGMMANPEIFPVQLFERPDQRNFWEQHFIGIENWIVREIEQAMIDQNVEPVYRAFASVNVSKAKREALIQKARTLKFTNDVPTFIENLDAVRSNVIRLANGKEIRQTQTGLWTHSGGGNEQALCNVGITIEECLLTESGDVKYLCKFRTAVDVPPVTAVLTAADFGRINQLRTKVQKSFLQYAKAVYPAFYTVAGYMWPDIFAKLAEGKTVRREVESLGCSDGLIHFPNFCIDTRRGEIQKQQQSLPLAPQAIRMYDGLHYDPSVLDSKLNIQRLLLAAADNPYYMGLLAAVCHWLYLITVGNLRALRNSRCSYPRHLVLVEAAPGVWSQIHLQFSQLFAQTDEIGRMPNVGLHKQEAELKQLGDLPCIRSLPMLTPKNTAKFLGDTSLSFITTVDSDTAIQLTGDSRIAFVDSPNSTSEIYAFDERDLLQLKSSLPGVLLDLTTKEFTAEERHHLLCAELPAEAMYRILCSRLNVRIHPSFEKLVKQYYTESGRSCIYMFLHELGQIREQYPDAFRVMHGVPQASDAELPHPPDIYVTREQFIVAKYIVNRIPIYARHAANFNVPSLTLDFERLGYLQQPAKGIQIDPTRFWILDHKLWDRYIMNTPISLEKPVDQNNVIRLPRMIANG